ncbi:MAG: hypothetical protein ACHREM_18015 [Polyangiales bacterium]
MASDDKTKALGAILRHVRGAFVGPVDRIEVRHLHGDGGETRVGALSGEKITGKGTTPDTIADDLFDFITEDSKIYRGTNRYVILFYRPGEREYTARCPVIIKNSSEKLSDSVEETEPATDKGLLSMGMRHWEQDRRETNREREMLSREREAMITRLMSMCETMSSAFPRILELEQQLTDRREERGLRLRREEKTDKIVERGVEQLMMLSGPLLGKILPGATGQAVASDAMTIQLLASLKPEQLQGLSQLLTPEQGAIFLELYKSLRDRYERIKLEEQKKTESETPSTPSSSNNGASQ